MSLSIKEINIGNYFNAVGFGDSTVKVIAVLSEDACEDGECVIVQTLDGKNKQQIPIHYLIPIEITRPLLEELGWSCDSYYAYKDFSDTQYISYYFFEGHLTEFYVHKNGKKEVTCDTRIGYKYLHQLQNFIIYGGYPIEIKLLN